MIVFGTLYGADMKLRTFTGNDIRFFYEEYSVSCDQLYVDYTK